MNTNPERDDGVTMYLAIESTELTSFALTKRLETRSDREWGIGEVRGKTGKRWDRNGWVLESSGPLTGDLARSANELIPIVIARFTERLKPIAKSISQLGSSAEVFVVLAILASETPGIELSHSFLELLATLGGTFQVDLTI